MLFRMNTNWIKMTPNGKIPARIVNTLGGIAEYFGISRGTLFVRQGASLFSSLYPKNDPTYANGTEIPNHMPTMSNSEKNGTASVECKNIAITFNKKKIPNANPDRPTALNQVTVFLRVPSRNVYRRAPANPLHTEENAQNTSIPVSNPPRFAGEKNPRRANSSVATVTTISCTPVPQNTARSSIRNGARNTSPFTVFHPLSSRTSSKLSRLLYRAKSLQTVRNKTNATNKVKKNTIKHELMIENHWTFRNELSTFNK
mmetsp:Transcript_12061/g.21823  ORF Transcript_12061/g.21823 Transcript_12061/m.21823 type:complete len:258 (-) Transcript_12061:986-1759(-)